MKKMGLILAFMMPGSVAFAHSGHVGESFYSGILHPLMGLDHLLTLLAVGVFSSLGFKNQRRVLPAAFSVAMVLGAVAAFSGFALPAIEQSITASLMIIGLVMVLALKVPLIAASALVIVSALFHGNAHGLEMPAFSTVPLYMLGFILVSISIQALGMRLGQRMHGMPARVFGAIMIMFGLVSAVMV